MDYDFIFLLSDSSAIRVLVQVTDMVSQKQTLSLPGFFFGGGGGDFVT